jgi:hypothetical protein
MDPLKVGQPSPFGQIVGMADFMADSWFLTANFTVKRHVDPHLEF